MNLKMEKIFFIAAKERPFTVAFLDIYMSGANGIETARELLDI